jgi:type II secretory pathway component PulF
MGIKFEKSIDKDAQDKNENISFFNKEIVLIGNKFSNKAKEQFYAELSVLLNSGVNLKRSLDLISEMQKKNKDKNLIDTIRKEIVSGKSLSETLEKNKNFTPYEYHAIKIGEQTGRLPKIISDLREFFNRKNDLKRQLISSLSYPIIVLITAILVVFFMLKFVVPMFVDIFKQNNVELPWLTEIIVSLSNFVQHNSIILLLVILVSIIVFKWLSKKHWYYSLIGRIQLKVPILNTYIKRIYLIQFTQAMALLTNARIPVVNGIHLVRNMIKFYPLENSLISIEKDIIQGEKLHSSFEKYSLYDKKMIALLKVAEETNQTEYIFQKLYEQYSLEMKYQGHIITNAFNFLLTLFVGIIVGVILIAMYLPMFKLTSVIG